MTSTLIVRKTPQRVANELAAFKQPIKGAIAKKFYDHDGSCGGGTITVDSNDLGFFEGLLAMCGDKSDRAGLEKIVAVLRDGDTIDMWFEH